MRKTGAIVAMLLSQLAFGQSSEDRARHAASEKSNDALIADLADDDVRWNALAAMDQLRQRGAGAAEALEAALKSSDWQTRQAAADILRDIGGPLPSNLLIEVTVEGLKDDKASTGQYGGRGDFCWINNAISGIRFLLKNIDSAVRELTAALDSEDAQQRFLCAYVLGMSGKTAEVARISEILTVHLRDNKIDGDAVMAAAALYRLGPAVIPHLRHALPQADEQAREMIRLIVLDLASPPANKAELVQRKHMQHITRLYHDPVFETRVNPPEFRWPPDSPVPR